MGWNLAFSAGACALSFAAVSPRFAAGLALGAVLEAVNFRSLWRSCERIFLGGRARRRPGRRALRPALRAARRRDLLRDPRRRAPRRPRRRALADRAGDACSPPGARARPSIADAPALAPDDPEWERWDAWRARERDADAEEEEAVTVFQQLEHATQVPWVIWSSLAGALLLLAAGLLVRARLAATGGGVVPDHGFSAAQRLRGPDRDARRPRRAEHGPRSGAATSPSSPRSSSSS